MNNEEDRNQNFKVVDKRRFNESGEDISSDKFEEKSQNVSSQFNQDVSTSNDLREEDLSHEDGKLDFPSFLVGMYSQTLIFLGEIPSPDTNLVSKNLDAAKQNIDIIVILEEKTKGNLSQEEENLIQEILNNLRLLFVKKL
jgi:hypothetical protein